MLRAQLRDWIAMLLVAWWLKGATAEQAIALGKHLVRHGIMEQTGQSLAPEVQIHYVESPEVVEQEHQQKWVA